MFDKNKFFDTFVNFLLIGIYLLLGIFILVFASQATEKNNTFCGVMVLMTGIVSLILFFVNRGYKNKEKVYHLVISILCISFGFIFVFSKNITLSSICLYWGIVDIVRSSLELKDSIFEIKQDKMNILAIIINIADIIVDILLCINLENGIPLHITYLGISFLITGIQYIVSYLILKSKKKGINE